MKLIKSALLFLVVMLTFGSCKEAQLRILHDKEIRMEIGKYSNVLDIERTEIEFGGRGYYWIPSSKRSIKLSLYLKPDCNNRETAVAIRDGLIAYFNDNNWDARGQECYPDRITIDLLLEEGEETKFFYSVYMEADHFSIDNEWFERWYPDLFGKPIIGETIRNEEFDTLLKKYSTTLDIERSDGYHYETHICIWLILLDGYDREMVIAIKDALLDFFDNSRQELTETNGQLDKIWITFYRVVDGYPEQVYYMRYRNDKWEAIEWI